MKRERRPASQSFDVQQPLTSPDSTTHPMGPLDEPPQSRRTPQSTDSSSRHTVPVLGSPMAPNAPFPGRHCPTATAAPRHRQTAISRRGRRLGPDSASGQAVDREAKAQPASRIAARAAALRCERVVRGMMPSVFPSLQLSTCAVSAGHQDCQGLLLTKSAAEMDRGGNHQVTITSSCRGQGPLAQRPSFR